MKTETKEPLVPDSGPTKPNMQGKPNEQKPVTQAQETKPPPNRSAQPKTEVKLVKHVFTQEERNRFGDELARTIAGLRSIQGEKDQAMSSFKSRITEAESRIDRISTDLMGGFEMREKRCIVRYFPKERKRRYWLEGDDPDKVPCVVQEDMSQDDFQTELIQAESKFNHRAEIQLFPNAGNDFGRMIVGEFNGMWFAALRVQIGGNKLQERLDSEQSCAKKRFDIIKKTAVRFQDWLTERLGKDVAKGFVGPMDKAILAEKERVE